MFENDGCTLWPDTWRGIDLRSCCDVHDVAFNTGVTVVDLLKANFSLARCIWQLGAWDAAILMFIGVCTGGAAFFFIGSKALKAGRGFRR